LKINRLVFELYGKGDCGKCLNYDFIRLKDDKIWMIARVANHLKVCNPEDSVTIGKGHAQVWTTPDRR
jgi:hypothetical protein